MSDIDDTLRTLTDQIEGLQADLEQMTEANQEWSDVMDNYNVDQIKSMIDLDEDYGIEEVRRFFRDHDLSQLQSALRYESIDELKAAYDKIDEYGDPRELAEKLEELQDEQADSEQYAAVVAERDKLAADLSQLRGALLLVQNGVNSLIELNNTNRENI